MNRLTEREPNWVNEEYWVSARNPSEKEMRAIYIKLRQYENTGLTPAEVAELAQAALDRMEGHE